MEQALGELARCAMVVRTAHAPGTSRSTGARATPHGIGGAFPTVGRFEAESKLRMATGKPSRPVPATLRTQKLSSELSCSVPL